LIYGYSHGITSSRALERRCHDDISFGLLAAQQAPDFVAISRFRTRHAEAFKVLFTQSLALCAQAGLVSLGRVALDGSKIRVSASRHRAMNDDRTVRAEGELAAEVEVLLADAQNLDAAEDAAYGPDRRGDELPVELARREGRLAAIRTAKAALGAEHRAEARAQAEQAATERGQDQAQTTQAGDVAQDGAVVPAKAQRSFTDPDARIMKTSDGSFHYCFNAQHVVAHRLTVGTVRAHGRVLEYDPGRGQGLRSAVPGRERCRADPSARASGRQRRADDARPDPGVVGTAVGVGGAAGVVAGRLGPCSSR